MRGPKIYINRQCHYSYVIGMHISYVRKEHSKVRRPNNPIICWTSRNIEDTFKSLEWKNMGQEGPGGKHCIWAMSSRGDFINEGRGQQIRQELRLTACTYGNVEDWLRKTRHSCWRRIRYQQHHQWYKGSVPKGNSLPEKTRVEYEPTRVSDHTKERPIKVSRGVRGQRKHGPYVKDVQRERELVSSGM